jgi:hypothetical protein
MLQVIQPGVPWLDPPITGSDPYRDKVAFNQHDDLQRPYKAGSSVVALTPISMKPFNSYLSCLVSAASEF